MPCRSAYDDCTPGELLAEQRRLNDKMKKDVDFLTKELCTVMGFVERNQIDALNSYLTNKQGAALANWWKQHKVFDEQRMKKAKENLPFALSVLNDLPEKELTKVLDSFKKK